MRWYRHYGCQDRDPYEGVLRELDADALIQRLLRSSDANASGSGVMPDVLAEKIIEKLEEHAKSPDDTVIGRIGSAFEHGDAAEIQVEHGGLVFQIQISAWEQTSNDWNLDFDDDDFDFDDEETGETEGDLQ